MTVGVATVSEWAEYLAQDFTFSDFPPGARVLDVGFGYGEQMRDLITRGCRTIGIDVVPKLVTRGRRSGLSVCQAVAEGLPFNTGSFDGVVCKVVIPLTDEARAVSEIARVLRDGGIARISYHGIGYYLRYLLTERNWKRRVYAARAIVNTWVYSAFGRRLPGFLGDTLYQSERRLLAYYRRAGLELVRAHASATYLGAPVFIYHTVRRRAVGTPSA